MAIYLPAPRPDSHSPSTWHAEHPLGSSRSERCSEQHGSHCWGCTLPGRDPAFPGTWRGPKPCPGPGRWELLRWQPSTFPSPHPSVFPGHEPSLPVSHRRGKLRRPSTVSPDECVSSCLSFISPLELSASGCFPAIYYHLSLPAPLGFSAGAGEARDEGCLALPHCSAAKSEIQKKTQTNIALKIAQNGSAGVVPQTKGEKETGSLAEMRAGRCTKPWSERGADRPSEGDAGFTTCLLQPGSEEFPTESEQPRGRSRLCYGWKKFFPQSRANKPAPWGEALRVGSGEGTGAPRTAAGSARAAAREGSRRRGEAGAATRRGSLALLI